MNVDEVRSLRLLSRRITVALVVVAVVGMTFTAVSVTLFAIDHGVSPWIAWTLDPMVAVALLVVLVADARLVELGVSPGGWPRVLRWFAGLATWAMNAWQSVWPDDGFGVPRQIDPAGVVLHSVAPVLLIVLAEAVTGYRRVIADRIRFLEAAAVGDVDDINVTVSAPVQGGALYAHPSLEVADGDAAFDVVQGSGHPLEDELSSWAEPWRAPWDADLEGWTSKTQVQLPGDRFTDRHAVGQYPKAPHHREASVGSFRDLTDDRLGDRAATGGAVVPVVAGWSSEPARDDQRHDHLDDQAHDHPETSWGRGEMVVPVVADPATCVAQKATQVYQSDDHLDNQGWAPTPTLDEVVTDDRKNPATVTATVTVGKGAGLVPTLGAGGYAPVHAPEVGGRGVPNGTPAANPVVAGDSPSTLTVADLPQSQPELSDADLRRAAKKLQREAVRSTGRPVTVDALRDGLGLSRRRAVALRREVVGVSS